MNFPWVYPVTEHTPQELRAQETWPTLCTPTYFLGILDVLKVDEGEPSGTPWLLIVHNGNVGNGAILGENLSQVSFCSVQTQPKHSKTTVWIRICLKEGTQLLEWNRVYLQCNVFLKLRLSRLQDEQQRWGWDLGHLLTGNNKLNLQEHKPFLRALCVSQGTETDSRMHPGPRLIPHPSHTYPVANVTSPGRHGGMAVTVPPPVVPTVRPASGSPVGAGPWAGPGVVSAGTPPWSRPEKRRQRYTVGLIGVFNISQICQIVTESSSNCFPKSCSTTYLSYNSFTHCSQGLCAKSLISDYCRSSQHSCCSPGTCPWSDLLRKLPGCDTLVLRMKLIQCLGKNKWVAFFSQVSDKGNSK